MDRGLWTRRQILSRDIALLGTDISVRSDKNNFWKFITAYQRSENFTNSFTNLFVHFQADLQIFTPGARTNGIVCLFERQEEDMPVSSPDKTCWLPFMQSLAGFKNLQAQFQLSKTWNTRKMNRLNFPIKESKLVSFRPRLDPRTASAFLQRHSVGVQHLQRIGRQLRGGRWAPLLARTHQEPCGWFFNETCNTLKCWEAQSQPHF